MILLRIITINKNNNNSNDNNTNSNDNNNNNNNSNNSSNNNDFLSISNTLLKSDSNSKKSINSKSDLNPYEYIPPVSNENIDGKDKKEETEEKIRKLQLLLKNDDSRDSVEKNSAEGRGKEIEVEVEVEVESRKEIKNSIKNEYNECKNENFIELESVNILSKSLNPSSVKSLSWDALKLSLAEQVR